MCGIVGLITSAQNGFFAEETSTFNDLLYMDALRGVDGTGVMYGDNLLNVQIHKEAVPAAAFMSTKEWSESKTMLTQRGKWAVGHNRAATRGSIKDENSHPFVVDDKIILVQNGSYMGDHRHLANVEVDSHAIAHLLAREANVEKALQQVNAAYCLVWYNVEEHSLNIVRNDQRPMHFFESATGSIVFASEGWMLSAACGRNNLRAKKDTWVQVLKVGYHRKFTFSKGGRMEVAGGEIDHAYRFRQSSPSASRSLYYPDLEDDSHPKTPLALAGPSWAGRTRRSNDVHDRTYVTDHVVKLKEANQVVMDPQQVALLRKTVDSIDPKTIFHVENFDYFPIFDRAHPAPDAWYIYGHIFTPAPSIFDGLLTCFEFYNLDELQALRAADGFYKVRIQSVMQRLVPNSKDKYYVVLKCEAVEVIQQAEEKATVQ